MTRNTVLADHIADVSTRADYPEAAAILTNHIRDLADDPRCVQAALLYGSGLWKEATEETVWDLHVLVSDYQSFRRNPFLAFCGTIIPPNVFFTTLEHEGRVMRCKFNVMRMDQFEKGCAGRSFTPQVWARFAQPCRIVFSKDKLATGRVLNALESAVHIFIERALPFCDDMSARSAWVRGLAQTYADELRSESSHRAADIFDTQEHELTTRFDFWQRGQSAVKRHAKLRRILRYSIRPLRKAVVFVRWIKAALTFENGVDYALWKIKRHSGVSVEATEFQRKYPLIAAWPLVWKLYRKGAFR
jgi:hypothetical protein